MMSSKKDVEARFSSSSSKRYRDSTHLIPTPGDWRKKKSNRFNTAFLSLPVIIITPVLCFLAGVALEVAIKISRDNNGFPVPQRNVFSLLSTQFLLTFFPTLTVFPGAFMYREIDFHIRWYQPYVILMKGNAPAEESLLLDYLYEGVVLSLFHAMRWKHRLIFWSSLMAVLTYAFQPLAAGIFAILDLPATDTIEVTSIRTVGLNRGNFEDLSAISAAAGYTEAAVYNNLGDPPFVRETWATAEFAIPEWDGFNGTLSLNTTAVRTKPNCVNPAEDPRIEGERGGNATIISTSVEGCTFNATLNPDDARLQYGVMAAPCGDNVTQNLEQQPVMFWYFHQRDDNDAWEVETVFCTPTLEVLLVTAKADLNDNTISSCERVGDFTEENDVLGPPVNGIPFNAVVFLPSSDRFIQGRALAIQTGIPGAVFRSAVQSPGGLQSTFDTPNGFLDLTSIVYRRHLAVSAKSIYFVAENSTLPGELTSFVPRLVLNPIPSHGLAVILILVGVIGLICQLGHRRQRRKLLLAAPPGTIASIVALTSRSGFGELLLPYDSEETIQKKLQGLRFRLDERTGAIVAEEASSAGDGGNGGYGGGGGRDEAEMALLGTKTKHFSDTSYYAGGSGEEHPLSEATSPGLSRTSTTYVQSSDRDHDLSPYNSYPPSQSLHEPLRTPYDP